MKDLYLMRHGQTFFNQEGLVQGVCDSPLTDLGIEQAKQARAFFEKNGIEFGGIYSSTQERASDTLEIVTGRTDYTRLKGVKEWNFGLFEAQPERLQPKFRAGAVSFEDLYVPYGGEDVAQVGERMLTSLTEVMKKTPAVENPTLVVSHGGAMWAFYLKIAAQALDPKVRFGNCVICHYHYENDQFLLRQVIDPLAKTVYDL
ncbi:histidine phosphatase family protein [Streptococcus anginosus]|uniref:Histidine phosphatase family protein n=2 Tax=Streptococcus TaxID=1301 RepID=A0AAU7PXG0_9STRE|nr:MULTISPECIES: histidine phosphatase family protein [Streptococcus]MBC5619435.1 histidine phosphatase family protein [Streptococcus hominis]MCW0924995.1 histidine phosphatase family protein [Streptococcus anginosus]QOG25380.1 histidine phosphatase family protein [Streptococcus sp. KS 6]